MSFSPRTSTRFPAQSALTRSSRPDRVREVDVLRGFALLGILLVNVQFTAGPQSGLVGEVVESPVDGAAGWLVTALLVSAKFYLPFSFLLGYSFTLQLADAEHQGAAQAPRHLRRVICLFLLGVAHAVLLFVGDILMAYACLSLLLFAARDLAPRKALRIAAWLLAGLFVFLLARGLLTLATTELVHTPDAVAAARETAKETAKETAEAYRGDPVSVVRANLRALRGALAANILYAADMLAAFLVGLAAGKHAVLAEPDRHRTQMKRIVAYGLPIGLAGGAFLAMCAHGPLDARWYDVAMAAGMVTGPALVAAYCCGLLLLLGRGRFGRRVGDVLAPAGRMSLTNYLTQSLVMALVFTGYGLGLYGRVGTVAVLAGCLVLYAAQLAFSAWLMGRTRYAPVEWLLRTATLARKP
ncbi:DUF418 domain-containing protein [Streptomyces aurantiacus]|uniref:DUF418 domain-containing protein n=1 Tax=Streptomyces aurantiacus TaxID=47760 RepID=UPI0007C7857D|nr:DUF418 domain-containing protein [Streptomyces aurantiacus]